MQNVQTISIVYNNLIRMGFSAGNYLYFLLICPSFNEFHLNYFRIPLFESRCSYFCRFLQVLSFHENNKQLAELQQSKDQER